MAIRFRRSGRAVGRARRRTSRRRESQTAQTTVRRIKFETITMRASSRQRRTRERSSMRVEWFGQSAFQLSGDGKTVAIDPFGDMSALSSSRGIQWDYPPIETEADVLLVTHEHGDHHAVEAIGGEAHTLRSTAGTLQSPLGQVTAIASEHDDAAGTERGPNTIFVFTLDGVRVAHMG